MASTLTKWRKRRSRALKRILFAIGNAPTFLPLTVRRRCAPDILFRNAWSELAHKYLVADRGPDLCRRSAPLGLHYRLRHTFRLFFRDFRPEISLRCAPDAFDVIRSRPGVIVSVHAFTEYAIASALHKAGIPVAFVTYGALREDDLALYRFDFPPTEIQNSPAMMLDCRSALRSGRNVMCDVDYRTTTGTAPPNHFISPSMFDFRRIAKAPLFFAHARVSCEGALECILQLFDDGRPRTGSGETDARAFVEFLNEVEGRETGFKVRAGPKVH